MTRCGREIRWVRKLGSMGIVILSAATVLRTRPAILAHISNSASSRTIVVADRTSRHGRGTREEDEGEGCEVAVGGGHAHDSKSERVSSLLLVESDDALSCLWWHLIIHAVPRGCHICARDARAALGRR